MPYKKQKAIRSEKKDVGYDLMTDLGLCHEGAVLYSFLTTFGRIIACKDCSTARNGQVKGHGIFWVGNCR